MKLAQPVGVLVGIGLMVAPAAFGYAGTGAGDLQRVVGPLAATFATIAWWEATVAVRWTNVVLAAVLMLAPLAFDGGTAAAVALMSGVLLAAATPFAGSPSHRFGGGWLALLHDDGESDRRQST